MSLVNEAKSLERNYVITVVIAAVFIMCLVIYAGLIRLMSTQLHIPPQAPGLVEIKYVLGGLGVLMVPMSLAFRNYLFRSEKIAQQTTSKNSPKENASPEQNAQSAAARIFLIGTITAFALAEAIAIYGLIIFFMLGDQVYAYSLIGAAFLSMVLNFPRRSALDELASRVATIRMMRAEEARDEIPPPMPT